MTGNHFRFLPKVELHLHLDCSLSFDAVRTLSPSVTAAQYVAAYVPPSRVTDLADLLRRNARSLALLQTPWGLRVAVHDLMRQLRDDGVVYAELRFAPLQHLEGGLQPKQVVQTVNHALEQAIRETGVEARLLLCTLRHFTAADSLRTAQLAHAFQGTYVVGLDLAGNEAGHSLDAHVAAFDYAHRHGLSCTAHAGEARGAQSVRETLDRLHPSRIGHGVRSIEEPELLCELKRRRVHLEVCPSCNVQIGIFGSLAAHPVDPLYRAGVSVGINTDTRTLTPTTLSAEYARLSAAFRWDHSDFLRSNLMALDASFAEPALKARLRPVLECAYA
ncbi:adenosine deaminase [Deinococcus hopiensis]|uniref:adenosine deaminase n=1 Tax=Deinococcus hopiensis KR-140 TaxID=695939 RepID=A0A1W1VW21_9DEIO|nr:adenosine deaminase [Deinococcus hopiensis]SMB97577.1 adenosine deaminase [Deinococcus hopiensis KR-140]